MASQTPEELRQHLEEQVGFLRASAGAYDDGHSAEAKRLATTLRILLYDKPNSPALLATLGCLHSMLFLDSGGEVDPFNLLSDIPLVRIEMSVTDDVQQPPRYLPAFDSFMTGQSRYTALGPQLEQKALAAFRADNGRDMTRAGESRPFAVWWELPVIKADDGSLFTRKDIVLGVAHKDGGAHIDPIIGESYARLTRGNSLGWMWGDPDKELLPVGNPLPAYLRQIAWEVDETLSRRFPVLGAATRPSNI